MSVINRAPQWEIWSVDVDGLTAAVANTAWDTDIQGKDEDEVYTIYVDKDGEQRKEVSEAYAEKYWGLHNSYGELIKSYLRPINE